MGNVYLYEVGHDGSLEDMTDDLENITGPTIMLHTYRAVEKAEEMHAKGIPAKEIAASFCRNCGNYIDPEIKTCGCETGCEPQRI